MADGDEPEDSQKTEEPTPKKLADARKKGQVAMSREINTWVMLFAGSMVILAIGPSMGHDLFQYLALFLEKPEQMAIQGGVGEVLRVATLEAAKILALPLMVMVVAAIVGPLIQVGPLFAPESIKPNLDKLSLVKGFQRLFSMKAIVEFLKGIVKLVIVSIVTCIVVYPVFFGIEHFMDLSVGAMLLELMDILRQVIVAVLIVLLVMAVADLVYQRADHYKKMKMTKQEIKDEYKTTEGDPQIKAKLRQLRAEKSRTQVMKSVERADVVIVNPTHYAVALQYDPDETPAPLCVAKGIDDLALRIKERAIELDIVVEENAPLARALYASVEMDDIIPVEHFEAVAKVISYVYRVKGQR
ncbi:MAG: flagellar biosynthesis protein FlhB [Micavibrio sp.]|nr:flagellar biosynthesis protein FlhB [Micavibrio sp.]|tara:strand:+ start:7463 stop:8533 length:1071 start_codon:yes stop_codon:yes gene_type:complete